MRDAALRMGAGRVSSHGERRPIMTRHKFAIGQTVDFARRLPSMSRPTGPYEVMSVLPTDEADSPTYRVKSQAEPFARAARETDLVAIGLAPSEQAAPRAGPIQSPDDDRLGRCDRGNGREEFHSILLDRTNQAGLTRPKAARVARASRNDKSRRVSSSHSARRTQTKLRHKVSRLTSRSSG